MKINLCSEPEEANAAKEKMDRMEERLKRAMEQNLLHSTTNVELDSCLSAMKSEREELQAKIDKLQEKVQDQEHSLVFEKTYVIYHIKRKTMEEDKMGITNIDNCIAQVGELELSARENLPARPAVTDFSNSSSKYSGTEGEIEEVEAPDLAMDPPSPPPTSSGGMNGV